MITTLWGTIGILAACLALFFLGAYCVIQIVVGIKLFIEQKEPIFLGGTIIYFVSAIIVVCLFLEILL